VLPGFISKEHIGDEEGVFAFYGLWAADVVDACQLYQWDLGAVGGGDKDFSESFDGVSELAHIPDPDGVSLACFDGGCDAFSAYGDLDDLLDLLDGDSVAGYGGAVEGQCKTLVQARCKQSGMRWHSAGLEPLLRVRCSLKDGRYWRQFGRWPDDLAAWQARRKQRRRVA